MKPIMQKNRHNPELGVKGDCLRACICSLLEISDDGVPNFVEEETYPANMTTFLRQKGYRMHHALEQPKDIEYYMVWSQSPRGVRHSVIYHDGKLIHDPHPDGGGVSIDSDTWYVWLEPRNNKEETNDSEIKN